MTRGILLIAFGHKSYGKWAYNMAHSLKHFNPEINIHLVYEPETAGGLDLSLFTSKDERLFERLPSGKIDVAGIKTRLPEFSPYDKTIYLDCDGIALKDISPLFELPMYSQALSAGKFTETLNYTWANKEYIWKHFGLNEDTVYPSIQSSIVVFGKDKDSKAFFKRLQENYKTPVPESEFTESWGNAGMQPDELYYSATFAQMGIVPDLTLQPCYFPHTHTNKLKEITDNHYILSMYGAGALVRPFAKDFYDRLMHSYLKGTGKPHHYKAHMLYKDKFSGRKIK